MSLRINVSMVEDAGPPITATPVCWLNLESKVYQVVV